MLNNFKTKKNKLLLGIIFLLIMIGGFVIGLREFLIYNNTYVPQAQSYTISAGNWDVFNKSQIDKLIASFGNSSPTYNSNRRPYVIFDWDNTAVFRDVEEATLIYQLENLRFAMTPDEMDKALRQEIPLSNFSDDFNNSDGRSLNIDLVVPDIIESYRWLYANYKGLNGNLSLEEVKKSSHYLNFITKVRYLYSAIGGTFDVSVSYPWVLYLFTGMDELGVRQLVKETLAWQTQQAIESVKWTSPESLPGNSGVVSVTWKNGLRLIPEMQNLFETFRAAGFDIWICTASFVDVIKEVSSNSEYGYNNPPEQVIGMELERDVSGKIMTKFREGYIQTQGKGKTEAIERFIVPKYGYGPIFIAGDSEGDMNMMQDFPETKLVLIINRLKGKDIATFSKLAYESYGKPEAKFLLQGRNENTGEFVKSQANVSGNESIILPPIK